MSRASPTISKSRRTSNSKPIRPDHETVNADRNYPLHDDGPWEVEDRSVDRPQLNLSNHNLRRGVSPMRMSSLVLVGLVLVLNGSSELMACQAPPARTELERINDDSISAYVEGKLAGDNVIDFARVDVETERGIVVLSGEVPTPVQKARAEQLAREVRGVKQVTNKLVVRSAKQP